MTRITQEGMHVIHSYLDQADHFIIDPSWRYSSLINHPYQFIRSIICAVKEQREETYRQHNKLFDIALTFVFSKYAIICLLTALILNEFIISRSPLYNTRLRNSRRKQLIKLSTRTQRAIQLSNIFILIYALCLPFFENDLIKCLFKRYMTFVIGYTFSTTISIVNHKLPLESSEYSLFELTVQYYFLERRLLNPSLSIKEQLARFKWFFIPDSSMALINLLIIHMVELFNIKKYRLHITCVVEFINMTYITTLCFLYGIENIPFIIQYRNFPKIFCTLVTVLSLSCFLLAVLVRWDPRNPRDFRISDLQYYSFMKNWWSQLNLTGEEDYSLMIKKFVQLIYSRKNTQLRYYHRELPPIVIKTDNKLIPDNIKMSLSTNSKAEIDSNISFSLWNRCINDTSGTGHHNFNQYHFFTLPLIWNICKIIGRYTISRFSNRQDDDELGSNQPERFSNTVLEYNTNFNEHENQLVVSLNEECAVYVEEEDDDYVLEEVLSDQEDEIMEHNNFDDQVEDDMDLLNLMLTADIGAMKDDRQEEEDKEQYWLREVTPIIGAHLMEDQRMTRSQYMKARNNSIFSIRNLTNGNSHMFHNETLDLPCAVCKTNERCIILWPCRCFALCENCRVSLALRGYERCVYCRQSVSGYSKVEIQ